MQTGINQWDYLIVTASNQAQAKAYESQLKIRRQLGLLSDVREVMVVADPDGRRVGSGGSTLYCLMEVLASQLDRQLSASGPEDWRKVLEKLPINILLLNQAQRKDFQKQRNSGFNQVLAKIAKKNNITIGINLDEIINATPETKSKILARVRQNVNLCNKNKLEMEFITDKPNKDLYNLKALGSVLKMPTNMLKGE